jgi:hypothetical protein
VGAARGIGRIEGENIMFCELMLIASICAQEPPAREEQALLQMRYDELDRLLDAFFSGPSPSSWRGEAQPVSLLNAYHAKNATIIALKPLARVASGYVRVCDIAEFVEDPEGLAPFLGTIVIGPAPEPEKIAVIDRAKTAQRIEEYGLAFDRYLLTGAYQVLVMRVKAAHDDSGKEENPEAGAAAPEAPPAPPAEAEP